MDRAFTSAVVKPRGPQRGNMTYEISKSQKISQDFKDFTKISKISQDFA